MSEESTGTSLMVYTGPIYVPPEPEPELQEVQTKPTFSLKDLLEDPEIARLALSMITKEDKEKEKKQNVSVVSYRVAYMKQVCVHCGSVEHREIHLQKSESYVYVDTHGRVTTVTFKMLDKPYQATNTITNCNHCHEYIDALSYDELKRRYWQLFENCAAVRRAFAKEGL